MATAAISIGQTAFSFVMGMLAAHDARVKAAKEENAAVNQAISALDSDLHTIITALNYGDMTEADAIDCCNAIANWYWQFIEPLQQGSAKGPGVCGADNPAHVGGCVDSACKSVGGRTGGCYQHEGSAPCSGTACTAGCCIGCNVVIPSLGNCARIIQAHGGTFYVCAIVGNKYGLTSRAAYTLTYKKPSKVTEEEITIDAKTGVVTVGALPSQVDVVIDKGVVVKNSQSDSGGVAGVTAPGATQTTVGTPVEDLAATEQAEGTMTALLSGTNLYIIIGAAAILLIVLMMPRGGMR